MLHSAAAHNQSQFEYRLADLLTRQEWQNPWVRSRPYREATGKFDGLARHISTHFPESVGAEFVRLVDAGLDGACASRPNFSPAKLECTSALVSRLLQRHQPASAAPTPETLVVHLRLGDVIDAPQQYPANRSKFVRWPKPSAPRSNWHRAPGFSARSWLDGGGVANEMFGGAMRYVRPRAFFARLRLPPRVTTAVVLGNTRFMMGGAPGQAPLSAPISVEYARRVVEALEARGLATSLRLDGEADADLAYMAGAAHFVRAGGGFSTLISHMVERHGGSVYPGLSESDWLEPRRVARARRKGSISFYPPSSGRRLEARS